MTLGPYLPRLVVHLCTEVNLFIYLLSHSLVPQHGLKDLGLGTKHCVTETSVGNALFCGLPQSSIIKLQCIQNAATMLLTGAKKFDRITPVLKSLHWLTVEKRIDFSVLLFVYRALHD